MATRINPMRCATCIACGGYPGICPDCGLLDGLREVEPRTERQQQRYPVVVED